jgi:putative ATP-binding cassette transporter
MTLQTKTLEAETGSEVADGATVDELHEAPAEDEKSDQEVAEPSETNRRRYLLHRFWRSARGFWRPSEGDRLAWPLTAAGALLILGTLGFQYGINVWNRGIFDALETHDAATVFRLSLLFVPLVVGSIACGVATLYGRMTLQRRWRAWLSTRLIGRWLNNGHYYQLNLVKGEHDNPEYRIAQDLRIATDSPVDFAVGVLSAALSALTFITVLWTIGGAYTFVVGGAVVTIPGFLVIAAVIYAVLASGFMILVGRRFVVVSERVNQAEADYRYVLTRIRENGESIALLGGEEEERAGLDRALGQVLRQWRWLLGQHMRTTVISQGSALVAPIVPIILSAPKFLDGTMTLGQVMQAASAFAIVQAAFGWLVDNYPRLADWSASARRTASLMTSLDALERAETGESLGRIQRGEIETDAVRLRDVSVTLDDGTAVIADAEVVIQPGERVLVAGESGSGKSTLVRAIAGLWPWGGGDIGIKSQARLFLQPQRSYIPIGNLHRAVAYPASPDDLPAGKVRDALEKVGLGYLANRIDEDAPWDQTLSGGEKQRLAFARMLLHQPDIIVLDEATSALDASSQDKLMGLISSELKGATILSVGHRSELEGFHSRKIVLERRRGAARVVSDEYLSPGRRRFGISVSWNGRRRRHIPKHDRVPKAAS